MGKESGGLGIENKWMTSRDLKCWEEERGLDPKGGGPVMTEKKVDEIKRFQYSEPTGEFERVIFLISTRFPWFVIKITFKG